MMRLAAVVILALLSAASARGQSTPSTLPDTTAPQSSLPAKNSSDPLSLPNGTGIVGVLSTTVDTKHAKPGDRVEVEVTRDVRPGGDVLLRTGSHITGEVTLAYAFSKGDSNAKLEIVFNNVIAKNGEQIARLSLHLCAGGKE